MRPAVRRSSMPRGGGGDCNDDKTLHQPMHMFADATNDPFLLALFPKAEGKEGDFEDSKECDVQGVVHLPAERGGILTKMTAMTCRGVVCSATRPSASMML
jgi:hypothetical protein